jgi:two-component system phosphate regulon sensor histidine kinase PhoR
LEQGSEFLLLPGTEANSSRDGTIKVLPVDAAAARKACRRLHDKIMDAFPSYLQARVTLLGSASTWEQQGTKPHDLKLLAKVDAASWPIRVDSFYVPDLLFETLRQRIAWTVGVIIVAAATALIGVGNAFRTMSRDRALSEQKSNFVSSVSHELRTPIASISLLVDSLRDQKIPDPEKTQHYYDLIHNECHRLSSLIGNLLDYSRIDRDQKVYETEACDLAALCEAITEMMRPSATDRKISLDWRPLAENSEAVVDPDAIGQALINLIDNAIKFSPGGSSVVVELSQSENGLEISVVDEGKGIPPAERDRIFDQFYRVGSELTREARGVGIGLSIVKHVADGHGGSVRFENNSGRGGRFVFTIPRSTETA